MPPKNSVEFSPELLYIHDAGAPLATWPPSIGKVNESRLYGLNHDCMIIDEVLHYADIDTELTKRLVYEVSCNGNFEKGEVIKAMRNNDILVKVGNKFYKPTNVECGLALHVNPKLSIEATLAPFCEVTTKELVDPFAIKEVRFNGPATIVFWKDGTKTVVKANYGDTFDPEKGLAMAFAKKALGNKYEYYGKFQKLVKKGMKK